ncbi:MAG: hypothetical protein ACYTFG_15570 [Planctomycetota bacterium]|jgi:hypothetical protein
MTEPPFRTIAEPPGEIGSSAVLTRLVDAVGFRFRWATEGLREKDFEFRGCSGAMTVSELMGHVWGLVNWVHLSLTGKGADKPDEPREIRQSVLEVTVALRSAVLAMDGDELARAKIHDQPFWNVINGPLADALTHVGQINYLRRMAGNPAPRANVFLGTPPREG